MTRGVLTIMDRGGGNPVIVDHAEARLSWQLSAAGAFSCYIPAREARRLRAAGHNWLGAKWVRYEYPGLPAWGGVVTATRWSPGLLEIGCESFHVLMRARRVPRTYGQQRSTAGALALRAFTDVQTDDYTGIVAFHADEWGDPIDWEWRGGDLYDDVLRQLVAASGQEWTVDADRVAQWRVRLGRDKRSSVVLAYPHEIVDYDLTGDLWTCENDIEGIAADTKYADAAYDRLDHDASIRRRGRYQRTRRYAGVVTKGTLRPRIKADLNRYAEPAQIGTLLTVNVAGSWSRYELGDTILVWLPDADVRLGCRIGARSIDVDAGRETLAVEVV